MTVEGRDPSKPLDVAALFGNCGKPLPAPANDAALLEQTLDVMKRRNIVAVTSGPIDLVTRWRAAAPDRVIPAVHFFTSGAAPKPEYAQALRALVKSGRVSVFAEITAQYRGLAPDHPSLEPFFALAEELDIPVGIHMGHGAPGGPYWLYPKYRASLGNPLLLEEVLIKHPKMRLYVMHAGIPMVDEMLALLFSHPQVYVDISGDNIGPRKEFHRVLRRFVEAGYSKRVMFGSDQMVWPVTIDMAIESIESADFLTAEQKRDILYNNAARFLRLTPEQIAKHHGR
jgi:predicted TIM-barrel fold metal-dependent hydrolase